MEPNTFNAAQPLLDQIAAIADKELASGAEEKQ
jgi:hypothetical protein